MFADFHLSPEALDWFAKAYESHMQGDFDTAITLYARSLDIEKSAEAYTFMAWAHSQRGDLLVAIDLCHQAISFDPDFGNPYNDIGSYLLQLGKLTEAAEWLERAKHAPRYASPEFPCCNLGRVHEMQGDWFAAMNEFRAALAHNPTYEPALEAIARLKAWLN